MKKLKLLLSAVVLTLLVGVGVFGAQEVYAAEAGEEVVWKDTVVAVYNEDGQMVYQPIGDAVKDRQALNELLGGDEKKTLVIPSGKTVKIDALIRIGSNTTIIATGATIVQTTAGKGLISHYVDGSNYNAIKNVTINGGTWKNSKNTGEYTAMRFVHGYNITVKNATVNCNYQSHSLEFIACKKVVVSKCTLKASNNKTKSSTSVEEALQIDIATPKTAPGVYSETGKKKYVNGQICQDITIKNSTISGSRGICSNYASQETKFQNKYHKNITITGCKITGTSAEAVALFNAVGVTLKNNTIKTKSTRAETAYANGVTMILWKNNSKTSSYKNTISGNTIYGMYRGLAIYSKCSSKYGTTTIKNNKIYVKKTKNNALYVQNCKKVKKSSNKTAIWK